MRRSLLSFVVLILSAVVAKAEVSSEAMNNSNNPLTPMAGLNFQDYMTSSIFGTDEDSNTFLLRGVMPAKFGGLPQIIRMTVPYATVPDIDGDKVSGVGDINIFDIFLMGSKELQLGIGPMLVLDTASKDETGAGKWQAGFAALAVAPDTWGMVGSLFTYQHDFAGDDSRPTQNIATMQVFGIYNLMEGFYLRSTGVWNFDWETGKYYIPIGAGLGKIWILKGGTTVNLFAEPQWTVAHEGDGVPNFQTFMGLNFQFPLK